MHEEQEKKNVRSGSSIVVIAQREGSATRRDEGNAELYRLLAEAEAAMMVMSQFPDGQAIAANFQFLVTIEDARLALLEFKSWKAKRKHTSDESRKAKTMGNSVEAKGIEKSRILESAPTHQHSNEVELESVALKQKAYSIIDHFEIIFRGILDKIMTAAFGNGWLKERLTRKMYDRLVSRRRMEVRDGREPEHLINYMNYSDYLVVIRNEVNWRYALSKHFKIGQEEICASLRRLNAIRRPVMHARSINIHDPESLEAETSRVLAGIRV